MSRSINGLSESAERCSPSFAGSRSCQAAEECEEGAAAKPCRQACLPAGRDMAKRSHIASERFRLAKRNIWGRGFTAAGLHKSEGGLVGLRTLIILTLVASCFCPVQVFAKQQTSETKEVIAPAALSGRQVFKQMNEKITPEERELSAKRKAFVEELRKDAEEFRAELRKVKNDLEQKNKIEEFRRSRTEKIKAFLAPRQD